MENNNEWKLEISKADNGYILKGKFNDSDIETQVIIEEKEGAVYDDNKDSAQFHDLSAMEELLYNVKNYFAIYYSKHNKRNLIIKIEEN